MKMWRNNRIWTIALLMLSLLAQPWTTLCAFAEETTAETTTESVEPRALVRGEVLIKSFNPGYTTQGEFLELMKLPKDDLSLAGLSVIYITSTGREYVVHEFVEGNVMVGESLLMRLASSDEVKEAEEPSDVADVTYTRNMSQSKGRINLVYADEVIDTLAWGLEDDDSFAGFNSRTPTTLVRDIEAEEVEDSFLHTSDYAPNYDKTTPGLVVTEIEEEIVEPKCRTVEFSEILTYYESSATEQFIELYNTGSESVELSGCMIKYKNKNYALSGEVTAGGFIVIHPMGEWGLTMTKNPTSSNILELVDADGEVVDTLVYSSGQKKGVSLAMTGHRADGSEVWAQTYNPTPGVDNIYQQFKTCPAGKVINLETGNCVNEVNLTPTLAACPEGKYRNPLTNRCKSYVTTASAELKPCAEGYERNPATGRCRKVVENNGADYQITTETFEEKKEFTAMWAIVIVVLAGIVYVVFQFKEELAELWNRSHGARGSRSTKAPSGKAGAGKSRSGKKK